jgi:hypothetical protein
MEGHDDDYDDAGWGKLMTYLPELSGNPTSRDICEPGGMNTGVRISHFSIFDTPTNL